MDTIKKHNYIKCLEIGMANGLSTLYILSDKKTTLISIDPNQKTQWKSQGLKFIKKYGLEKIKADGASQAEIASKTAEMEGYKKMYSNPFGVIFLTYMEILPVGLVVSLISALILKRK